MQEQERIIIKIGSSSLTGENGGLDEQQIQYFAKEMNTLRKTNKQIILVTSGAVAAGFKAIGYAQRPQHLHEKQAAAAVGQALLMQAYHDAFAAYGIGVAQILLTRSDFSNRSRMQNASLTMEELLRRGVIPIINENDTVSVDELRFGDNDSLSALVGNLMKADQLVIITDMDGLYTADPRKDQQATRIERVQVIDEHLLAVAGGAGSDVGTGGMRSKLDAAKIAIRGGIPVFVGQAVESGDLQLAIVGAGKGTYFDTQLTSLPIKKQWLGFHSSPQGTVYIDDGAVKALLHEGRSLLPVGVVRIVGAFQAGDVVEVSDLSDQILGRGVVNYSSDQLQVIAGLSTQEIMKRLDVTRLEVIHRDAWIHL